MLGSLYKITNNINGKVYIGKTYNSIQSRFQDHVANASRFPNRKLSKAINKYGKDSFSIELISKYEQGCLEDKEVEAIKLYNSYKEGYNSTVGGDGRRYIDISDNTILETYKGNLAEASRALSLDRDTIKKVLVSNNIPIAICSPHSKTNIYSSTLNMSFNSVKDAAEYLISNNLVKITSIANVRRSILRVLDGTRKSYCKISFQYGPI